MWNKKKVLAYALSFLTVTTIVYASFQGDMIKAGIFSDGRDITLTRDLTVPRNLTVVGTITGTGGFPASGVLLSNGEKILNTTDSQVIVQYDDDAAELGSLTMKSTNTLVSANDYLEHTYEFPDSAGNNTLYGVIRATAVSVTNTAEVGKVSIYPVVTDSFSAALGYDFTYEMLIPNTDNLLDLGSSSNRWQDLYVSGSVNLGSATETVLGNTASGGLDVTQVAKSGTVLGKLLISGASNSISTNDTIDLVFRAKNSTPDYVEYGAISVVATDKTAATEDSTITFRGYTAGSEGLMGTLSGASLVLAPAAVVGSASVPIAGIYRTNRKITCNSGMHVGATAGWVVSGANVQRATIPQSQTGSTLVIPVDGLSIGSTITAFNIRGQIEAAGNTVTVDAALFKETDVAADVTDTNLGAITQISQTADYKIVDSKTLVTPEVVAEDEHFYILVTCTTGGTTDAVITGAVITFDETN